MLRTQQEQRLIEQAQKFCGVLLLICAIAFLLWLGRVTADDVATCVEATGWTEARCQMELSR